MRSSFALRSKGRSRRRRNLNASTLIARLTAFARCRLALARATWQARTLWKAPVYHGVRLALDPDQAVARWLITHPQMAERSLVRPAGPR